jgi:hypothetical protein
MPGVSRVGNFLVMHDKGRNVPAITTQQQRSLALRCHRGALAVTIITGDEYKWEAKETAWIEFRSDKRPVVNLIAIALDDSLIQIATSTDVELLDQIAYAKEIAFGITSDSRVSLDATFTLRKADTAGAIFKNGRGK